MGSDPGPGMAPGSYSPGLGLWTKIRSTSISDMVNARVNGEVLNRGVVGGFQHFLFPNFLAPYFLFPSFFAFYFLFFALFLLSCCLLFSVS